MHLASVFALVSNIEPFVETGTAAQCRQLNERFANKVRISQVLVKDLQEQIITNILNVNVHILAWPLWLFALITGCLGPDSLLTRIQDNVGIHLSKNLSITLQLCLYCVDT